MKLVIILGCLLLTGSTFAQDPVCTEVNGAKGWLINLVYNNHNVFVKDDNCDQNELICSSIGTKSEGWYVVEYSPMKWFKGSTLACNSEYGQELLNDSNYICRDEIIYIRNVRLAAYDNCSQK